MGAPRAKSAFPAAIAWAVAAGLLALVAAPLWHHHDADHEGHEPCTVCAAVHQPRADDAAAPAVVPAAAPVALVDEPRPHAPAAVGRPAALARGPPAA